VRLAQLLQSFGCIQHATEPTHVAGHTLDLVITRADTNICNLRVGGTLSDHAFIRFTLGMKKSTPVVQHVERTAWRRLSNEEFAADLAESPLCRELNALESMSVDDLVQLYNQQILIFLTSTAQWYEFAVEANRQRRGSTPIAVPLALRRL